MVLEEGMYNLSFHVLYVGAAWNSDSKTVIFIKRETFPTYDDVFETFLRTTDNFFREVRQVHDVIDQLHGLSYRIENLHSCKGC